ncbi:putative hydroxypyruvate isomerase [Dendroctonus ponderosae]|uniref:Putative hydroxypyruvate isomerase n=1 Tax=Dendroctonus ponderosae TaxID=77166 RepID=J3JX49_DENPD|nr:putative hydroxypyruvate isomerase [Dendroctonus ponderosae]AEE62779.1 unknown [Dendroctonus ponderosae]ERL85217.1 hypothetical protein D910_02638 [Dendroctonus ponderosae]KAH1029746.1 hypothetical protein HUJ05_002924 [Dendroctonus ponderosae]
MNTCLYLCLMSLATGTRAMLGFCANLSFLFKEKPFLERYAAAADAGFRAVETGFPFGFSKEDVVKAKISAGIEQVLINSLTGDVTKGELGYAAVEGKKDEFRKSILTTIDYAKAVGAKKIHIMSGVVQNPTSKNDQTLVENLKFAAELLQQENILGVIEPINNYSIPNYYLNSYEKAIEVIKAVDSAYLKLQLDIFHLQLIKGDITHTIEKVKPYIGHIQIAQAPGRNEPDTPGEINYNYVLDKIQKDAGYADWIGLEYIPLNDTVEGLKWVKNYGYSL